MAIIAALEAKKADLTEKSKLDGIKGMKAKNELAQLLAEDPTDLNRALLTAEAALRRAKKKFGAKAPGAASSSSAPKPAEEEGEEVGAKLNLPSATGNTAGTMWWLEREMEEAKKYKFSGQITVKFVGEDA